jgi:hypothetical protein
MPDSTNPDHQMPCEATGIAATNYVGLVSARISVIVSQRQRIYSWVKDHNPDRPLLDSHNTCLALNVV